MHSRGTRSRRVSQTAHWVATLLAVFGLTISAAVPATAAATATTPSGMLARMTAPAAAPSASVGLAGGPAKMTLNGWSAGNIISDAVFTNRNTMSEAEIQAFFNSKVTKCAGGIDESGRQIVCLKDFTITSVDRPADKYCAGYTGAPRESAARVIYRVAQSCNINPQVLIVMLQKEQSLVTHTWPSMRRFDAALGQGCPDAGVSCDPKFVGFFHQVYGAARQMQIYMEGKYFTYYAPGKTWDIYWHPPVLVNGQWVYTCGAGPVYVANKATSALYYYTPYQPNAAALKAGYGSGDGCSAYGNRNFYNYFTDWFGSTQVSASTPTVQPFNTSQYVLAVDSAGSILAYPFLRGRWGAAEQVATGFAGSKVLGVGDLDGDGQRDALAVEADGTVTLVSGDGTKFTATRQLTMSWRDAKLMATAGDFSGDGIPDAFTTTADGSLLLWRGDERGNLRKGIVVGSGWQGMDQLSGGVDISGDGYADLLARSTGGGLFVYYGNGRGGWAGSQYIGPGWNGFTSFFSPGDFDADGRTDILGRDASGQLRFYRGVGGAGFAGGEVIGVGWESMSSLASSGAPTTRARPLTPGTGDLDSDGATDVVAKTAAGQLMVYRGNGSGGWKSSAAAGSAFADQKKMFPMNDFDGDGARDLGSIDSAGRFFLWRGDGQGGFAAARQIGQGWDATSLVDAGIDFDGDRRPDVLARTANGDLYLYRGDGAGTWAAPGVRIGSGWSVIDAMFNVGDFDGDGRTDVMARRGDDGSLWLYPTDGRGGWKTPEQIGRGWESMTQIFAAGDFDGAGHVDVLARSSDGTLMLYPGNGNSGWGAVRPVGWGWGGFTDIR